MIILCINNVVLLSYFSVIEAFEACFRLLHKFMVLRCDGNVVPVFYSYKTLLGVKSYSTTQPLAAKYSYIMYSVIDSSDTSFAYTENI